MPLKAWKICSSFTSWLLVEWGNLSILRLSTEEEIISVQWTAVKLLKLKKSNYFLILACLEIDICTIWSSKDICFTLEGPKVTNVWFKLRKLTIIAIFVGVVNCTHSSACTLVDMNSFIRSIDIHVPRACHQIWMGDLNIWEYAIGHRCHKHCKKRLLDTKQSMRYF